MEDEYYAADTNKKFGPRSRKGRSLPTPEQAIEFVEIALEQELKEALARSPHSSINAKVTYTIEHKSETLEDERDPKLAKDFVVRVIKAAGKRRFDIKVTAGNFQMLFDGQFYAVYKEKTEETKTQEEKDDEKKLTDFKAVAVSWGINYDG